MARMPGVRGKRPETKLERPAGPSQGPERPDYNVASNPRGAGDLSGGVHRQGQRSRWGDFRFWEAS